VYKYWGSLRTLTVAKRSALSFKKADSSYISTVVVAASIPRLHPAPAESIKG